MARVGRLSGAILAESEGAYFLVGDLKEPCDFSARGFEAPVELGAMLFLDGREVGRVTSAVMSPRLGAIGLAILHHSAWTPGARLVASGEIAATVSDLPFDK